MQEKTTTNIFRVVNMERKCAFNSWSFTLPTTKQEKESSSGLNLHWLFVTIFFTWELSSEHHSLSISLAHSQGTLWVDVIHF